MAVCAAGRSGAVKDKNGGSRWMNTAVSAEHALREGDVALALRLLQASVRNHPGDVRLRTFLFQLLAVCGQWERALAQLGVVAELDAAALPMAQMYKEVVRCELLRAEVFAGKRSPLIFGEPEPWLALLIESLLTAGQGRFEAAEDLRARAFDEAPATPGEIDGQPFAWLADSDMRLGPVCEAVIHGRYYWLPFDRLARISLDPPADLRDFVWMPAHFTFSNGGEGAGVIPTRYPGSDAQDDGLLMLARRSEWTEVRAGVFHGLGQRVLTTDGGDFPLLDVRQIVLASTAEGEEGG